MKTQALVSLGNFTYAKRNLKVGQTFCASPRDARILVALKKAQIDPAGRSAIAPVQAIPPAELPKKELVMDALGVQQTQEPTNEPKRARGRPRRSSYFNTEDAGPVISGEN